jgi:tyrosyl-tRNA synthetase
MTKISTDQEKIQELMTRGVQNIYPSPDFLTKALKSGKQLTLYLGIDPTGPSLHLGHAIPLKKLAEFQALGHKVIMLIGNFTATIGDPTDKAAARQPLTRQQVLDNSAGYKKQAKTFLKFSGSNKAELKYNAVWLDKLNFANVLGLASHFTVQQLLERDMFDKRMKDGKPIGLHEFLYPVMQAYDSVAMNVDGELGGNDQTFNMLAGRTLMKSMDNKEKFVITMKLLADSSGTKMGKTEGNMLSLADSAQDMFGKVMAWTDEMILNGFELCTNTSMTNIKKAEQDLKSGTNPRDIKFKLATDIVALYYSEKEATQAGEEFNKIFSDKGKPTDIPEFDIATGKINPVDLLINLKFSPSKNEAKRLITGGGFKINDNKIEDWKTDIDIKSGDIVQAGKRKFGKIK